MILGIANFGFPYCGKQIEKKEVFKILEFYDANGGQIIDTAYNYGDANKILKEYGWKKKIITKIWNKEDLYKNLNELGVDSIYCCMARENTDDLVNFLREEKLKGTIMNTGLSCYLPSELTRSYFNTIEIPCSPLWFKHIEIMTLYAKVFIRSYYNLFIKYSFKYRGKIMEEYYDIKDNDNVEFVIGVDNVDHLKENMLLFKVKDI